MEIERKWLLNGFPEIAAYDEYVVTQAYLHVDDELEVRIREAVWVCSTSDNGKPIFPMLEKFTLSIKGKGDISRIEVEKAITEDEYNALLSMLPDDCKPVIKDYRKYKCNYRVLEVSLVDDNFYYGEVEFDSERQAKEFHFPGVVRSKVISEVTEDPQYKMKNYWKRTRLNILE